MFVPPRESLSLSDAAKLDVFYRAYRAHQKPKTWRQLRKMGFKPIEQEKIDMKYIISTTELNTTV